MAFHSLIRIFVICNYNSVLNRNTKSIPLITMRPFLKKIGHYFRNHKGVVIIVTAALLLELVSIIQYYYTQNMLESELDRNAENELRTKAIIIRNMLNLMEKTLHEHLWDLKRNINNPDSLFEVNKRTIMVQEEVKGSSMTFVPYHYPEKGRLFEPFAYKTKNGIHVKDLAEDQKHDYTTHPAYTKMLQKDKPFWSDPYDYQDENGVISLSTYLFPIHNHQDSIIGIFGLDISLEWIGDTINSRNLYPSSYVILMTESGELISRPKSNIINEEDVNKVVSLINDSTIKRRYSESRDSKEIHFKDNAGKSAMVYYANMRGMPHWQIAVVCYDNEVYSKLHWMGINMLILMLVVFGILGLIVRRFILDERKLSHVKSDKERIDNELRIATAIQNAMLEQDKDIVGRSDLDVGATLMPAREVGGDLYNYFIRDEKLFFCIGDVSGKGIPSALIMAMTQALFGAVSAHESNPGVILKTINKMACQKNETNMFATLFIGVLDLPSGRLRYCNAGHDAPIVIDGVNVTPLPVKANLPVGLFDDFPYEIQEVVISDGSILFLYTDGLTEARDKNHKQFGIQRVNGLLNQLHSNSPKEIISAMIEQVGLFTGEEEQSDDLTMFAFRYLPQTENYTTYRELTIKNDINELKNVDSYIKGLSEELHLAPSIVHNIRLAVEETVVNIIDYAYPSGSEGLINMKAMYNENNLKLVFTDTGAAFDPTEVANADTTLSIEDRPIGGLGIFLVRELMDSINYERSEGRNILTMIKKLGVRS